MQQFVKIVHHFCATFFYKKRGCFVPHFYSLPLICAGSAEMQYCSAFYLTRRNSLFFRLGFERTTRSQGIRLLRRKMALKEDSTLSGIAAHFHGLRRASEKRHRTFTMTVHFSDCGTLGTIAAQPSKYGAHNWRAQYTAFSKCGCRAFIAFFFMHTV